MILVVLLSNSSSSLGQSVSCNDSLQQRWMEQKNDPARWDTALLHVDLKGLQCWKAYCCVKK